MNEVLTLYELNNLVRELIEVSFDQPYWVVGELSDVSTPAFGGHFYGELVQKDEESDRIVARGGSGCRAGCRPSQAEEVSHDVVWQGLRA